MMRQPPERRSGTWQHGARSTTYLSTSARLRRWLWRKLWRKSPASSSSVCSSSRQRDSAVNAAQKRLYFLRRLKKFGMSAKTPTNIYRCTIESILSGCITAWFSSCSTADRKALRGWWRQWSASSAAISLPCKALQRGPVQENVLKQRSGTSYRLLYIEVA